MSDAHIEAACAQRSRLRAVAGDGRDAGPQTNTMPAPPRRAGGDEGAPWTKPMGENGRRRA
ncbi:hypothetical protein [Streptomyces peucetius]|uniref:Uncharacterized protein n=1 Tax=Streptomyces peucetius TaxID=1950 RepID=A0ABY6I098_STRPE|nr:hypothetical protein [Streptomyces peucetius]UYQ60395.1 hypothetical protein OGH68_02135 [Streptomyces peucetius]